MYMYTFKCLQYCKNYFAMIVNNSISTKHSASTLMAKHNASTLMTNYFYSKQNTGI